MFETERTHYDRLVDDKGEQQGWIEERDGIVVLLCGADTPGALEYVFEGKSVIGDLLPRIEEVERETGMPRDLVLTLASLNNPGLILMPAEQLPVLLGGFEEATGKHYERALV